jgi:hypothetical protein
VATLQRFLLRLAPARVVEASGRLALRNVPGIEAIEALRMERARGELPRVTAVLRIAEGRNPGEVCRSAAIAIYELLPPVELRILVVEPRSGDGGHVIPLMPM